MKNAPIRPVALNVAVLQVIRLFSNFDAIGVVAACLAIARVVLVSLPDSRRFLRRTQRP